MSADAWITLAVTLITIVLLALDRFPPPLVMGGAVTALLVAGVIDEKGALAGFANEAPVTVAALYILAGAAEITGALDGLTSRALGSKGAGDESTRASRRQLSRIAYPSMTRFRVHREHPAGGHAGAPGDRRGAAHRQSPVPLSHAAPVTPSSSAGASL